ncbi:hypothetical protein [Reinekea marinisedimentorum]|uniref:Uncharacterized protein n=1 Tax=Reinekea marinisedimentorum TaxID=230495 RepID=A0A4R3IB43_9GAMM|nr:hypothetical protein [Reinekea marinisedimentorum]TCS43810.1 hypothetical protein BCF53_101153 [Reinekea marinisedimentorum]
MSDCFGGAFPVHPALVYLLHQLKVNGIGYQLYGPIPNTDMVFVDLERRFASNLNADDIPEHWSIISPHYLSHRALINGDDDPIHESDADPEAVVLAYGGPEAECADNFRALCEQVSYLRQYCPSRLVYSNSRPPEPMEIQELILKLKAMS